jgi:hypothetical protein
MRTPGGAMADHFLLIAATGLAVAIVLLGLIASGAIPF